MEKKTIYMIQGNENGNHSQQQNLKVMRHIENGISHFPSREEKQK